MARYTYTGDDQRVYPWYFDADEGTTLVAEPGETYGITVAAGYKASVPPDDGRWKPADAAKKPSKPAKGDE